MFALTVMPVAWPVSIVASQMEFLSEPGAILAREPSVSNTGRQSGHASPQVAHGWPEVNRTIGPLGPEKASHARQFGTLGGHRSGSGDRGPEEPGAGGVVGSLAVELHATATMKESATSTTPVAFGTRAREVCRATKEDYRWSRPPCLSQDIRETTQCPLAVGKRTPGDRVEGPGLGLIETYLRFSGLVRLASVRRARLRRMSGSLATALDQLPKVELHCHIEGTIRATTLIELADRQGIQLPATDPTELYRYDSLDGFL